MYVVKFGLELEKNKVKIKKDLLVLNKSKIKKQLMIIILPLVAFLLIYYSCTIFILSFICFMILFINSSNCKFIESSLFLELQIDFFNFFFLSSFFFSLRFIYKI
jgi:hypothetical protein